MDFGQIRDPDIVLDQENQCASGSLCSFAFINESVVLLSADIRRDLVHVLLCIDRHRWNERIISEWKFAPDELHIMLRKPVVLDIMFSGLLPCVFDDDQNGISSAAASGIAIKSVGTGAALFVSFFSRFTSGTF